MPFVRNISSFGCEIVDIDIESETGLDFLEKNLENLVWEYGFVLFKELKPHWSTINTIAHILGNVAEATPVDHPECIFSLHLYLIIFCLHRWANDRQIVNVVLFYV